MSQPLQPPAAKPLQLTLVIWGSFVYYGWIILAAGTLGLLMTTPGQTIGVSVFLDSIIEDLGYRDPWGSALIYGSEKNQPETALYCRKVFRDT